MCVCVRVRVALVWVAPEVLRASEGQAKDYSLFASREADVYSFGVVMQEIATSDEPYFAFDLDLAGHLTPHAPCQPGHQYFLHAYGYLPSRRAIRR